MNKTQQFEKIKEYFLEQDNKVLTQGNLPMRSTEKGFWGCSNLDDVYVFFERLALDPATQFIDLGCGDGRVVCVAALFCQASGVEYDKELIDLAQHAKKNLDSDALFIQEDMRNIPFNEYDILYMYADQQFDFIKDKLEKELTGSLYLYHDTYHPTFLHKERITWIGQIPIFRYTTKE